ncbi:MAG TPA: glycosyltransferase family 4 protein [Bryobacteraceae bacterium]|jgi:glycosyltransferase involved in cell wall biosynthesis
MKILIADQFADLGGAQRVLLELLPALQRECWDATLALPGRGDLQESAAELGIRTVDIACGPFGCGSKNLADYFRFVRQFAQLTLQFRRMIEDLQPDLLYLNGPRLVPAACALGEASPPIVFHLHSYLRQRSLAFLTGRSLRRARASVIANCEFVLEPLRKFLPHAEVVYNGVSDHLSLVPKRPTGRIGIIGRISPGKGQHLFIQAVRLIRRSLPQLNFLVCGDAQFSDERATAYAHYLRQQAADLPVTFTGWCDDIGPVLHDLDLLVVASLPFAEATTRVIPEAYSARVPVLAPDLPGIREILKDGHTGFLFPPGNAGALANRIREITSRPSADLLCITRNARCEFEKRFSLDAFHHRMLSSLKTVGAKLLA